MQDLHMVMMTGPLTLRGTVVWLTPQQGGRAAGPPEPDYDTDYTATAFVPPRTSAEAQVGVALRRFAPGAWRSPAEGVLVPPPGTRPVHIAPGGIVVITEGERHVAVLTVEEIHQVETEPKKLRHAVIDREMPVLPSFSLADSTKAS
jgi:hypothetical protein